MLFKNQPYDTFVIMLLTISWPLKYITISRRGKGKDKDK